ncbi:hypothetical protein REPUB_Repub11eG0139700 [Reevesia pubescens]
MGLLWWNLKGFAGVFTFQGSSRENKEMAATIAARSSFLRPIFRIATRTTRPSTRTRIPFSVSNPSLRSNFTLHQTRISPPSLSRLVRRELSTLQPVHSAVASACLVSKLPRDANCAEVLPENLKLQTESFRNLVELLLIPHSIGTNSLLKILQFELELSYSFTCACGLLGWVGRFVYMLLYFKPLSSSLRLTIDENPMIKF